MASPDISFTQIPSNVRKSGVYLEENTSNALSGLAATSDKIVIIAQKTASGIVASKTPTLIFDDATAALDFGQGSIAHLSAKAALEANPNASITVLPVDDNGSTKAAGQIAVSGTSANGGAIAIFIGDVEIDVSIGQGWTAAQGATGIVGAIQAVQNTLPVVATLSGNNVILTAKNAGTLGNEIPTNLTYSVGSTGMVGTITQLTGGAADPDLGDYASAGTVLNAIAGASYTIIANTLHDATNMGKVKNLVEFVSGPMEQRPAIQVTAATDEFGSFATVTAATALFNHGRTTYAYTSFASGSVAKTESFKLTGAYAAELAATTDPVVPYDGLPLVGTATPTVVDRFTRTQQEAALNSGTTPLIVAPGEQLSICRAISTYVTNSLGSPDPTLLDITTIRTLDYVRFQVLVRLQNVFVRAKLSTKTPARVVTQVLDVLYQLQALEIVQNVDLYKSQVIAQRDTSDVGRIDVSIPANIVTGLHVIAGVISLKF